MIVETQTIRHLLPEVLLILAASGIFVGGAFVRGRRLWSAVALASYVFALLALALAGSPWNVASTLSGPIVVDPMSCGLRWLAVFSGGIFTLALAGLADKDLASEILGSLMLIVVGIMLTAGANELVLLLLGLELISIPTYVLLFLGRRDRASGEATMKYFFLSLLSSALLLYGFSFLYGLAGTTVIAGTPAIPGIREKLLSAAMDNSPLAALAPLALVLIVAGLGFKLAAAPFQFYAPDVYQGTTNINAGLLAVAPKIAATAGFIRLVIVAMPLAAEYAWQVSLVIAVLTMTIGNVCALWQKDVRRLLAYSSIAHGGYLLIGLAVGTGSVAIGSSASGGAASMLFYVLVYALATMGTFATLAYLGSQEREVSGVEELSGLGKSRPLAAAALAIFMFSLAGIPPLAGFWGKFALFSGAIQFAAANYQSREAAWFIALAIIGVLNAAVAAAYYLRIIGVMYFSPAGMTGVKAAGGSGALAAAVVCAVLVIFAGLFPAQLVGLSLKSEQGLRQNVVAVAESMAPRPGER
ncbi:MAG TPA: NADH-quinone oxidoreductase subunit N [Pirellulaceae bacterium]|nr:NADH-quinone oxidoreductase subunit N [Pirellulaceae bacterium]